MYNDKLNKDLREKKITLRFSSRICLSANLMPSVTLEKKKKRKNKETKKKL